MSEPQIVLALSGISKRFPGVVALDSVNFDLRAGETHVLFGENGAGKSTLISIIAGVNGPDAGSIMMGGSEVSFHSVADARRRGVSAVFQEFSLAPTLTVAENIVMGELPGRIGLVDRSEATRIAGTRLADFGFNIPLGAMVGSLTRAEQQMVEIAKAFRSDLRVLILDEPTASLNDAECEQLYRLVADVKARGVGIVYVTHRMGEIARLSDRITVLRDGKYVATVPGSTPADELIRLMSGRVMEQIYPPLPQAGDRVVVRATNINTRDGHVVDASFEVREGEIVGFAGLMGSGKSHAIRACAGVEPIQSGVVEVNDRDLSGASISRCISERVMYLPPDRKHEGLLLNRPLRESVSLPWLSTRILSWGPFLKRRSESSMVSRLLEVMKLSPPNPERPAESYSGGNQQKALLARSLMQDCVALFLDEPTVGVDVSARLAIYSRVVALAESGAAVVIVSSDLPEVLHLCHRVYVFSQGHVTGHFAGEEIDEELILQHMMHWDEMEAAAR